jgi:lysophospholipase L1-like esterase
MRSSRLFSLSKAIVLRTLTTLAATVLLIEIVFRLWPPGGLTRDVLVRGGNSDQMLITPHPYIGYTLRPGFTRPLLHHNALGFRGPEIRPVKAPGTMRLFCLGDSSTYGFSISRDEATWPARLQLYLNANTKPERFEVINAGAPGYSSFECLSMLEYRGLDLQPDIVVVYLGFNDLRASTWPKVAGDNSHFRKSWGVPERPLVSALELSETFLLARWFFTDYRSRAVELARYVIVPEDGDQLTHGLQPPKEQGFANFRRNLQTIVAVAREHHARVLLLTQAYGEATIDAQRAPIIGAAMARFCRIVREVSRDHPADVGIALLDARRLLPTMSGIFTDGVHMNDDGADFLARLITARLIELHWTTPDLQNGPRGTL